MSSRPTAALLLLPFLVGPLLVGCGPGSGPGSESSPSGSSPAGDGAPTPRMPTFDFTPGGPVAEEELGEFHVVLECSVDGEPLAPMTVELWPEAAPRTVRRFLRHADEGWFDGTPFHRILRDFVVQGGDPRGNGTGTSPHGMLPQEVSLDLEHSHRYGVLSMAKPPSIQFFICVAESTPVWALDHAGHNAFGHLVHGVASLESIANTPTDYRGQERSIPRRDVRIDSALVVRGPIEERQEVQRPPPDLGGEPEVVAVRHILVTFLERGRHLQVTRNRAEAEALARECYQRLRSGELTFEEAHNSYSDESFPGGMLPLPRRITNFGVLQEGQRARSISLRQVAAYRAELGAQVQAGTLTSSEMARLLAVQGEELAAWVAATAVDRREEIGAPAYAEVAFGLEVGEVGFVPYDQHECPGGFYILQREE